MAVKTTEQRLTDAKHSSTTWMMVIAVLLALVISMAFFWGPGRVDQATSERARQALDAIGESAAGTSVSVHDGVAVLTGRADRIESVKQALLQVDGIESIDDQTAQGGASASQQATASPNEASVATPVENNAKASDYPAADSEKAHRYISSLLPASLKEGHEAYLIVYQHQGQIRLEGRLHDAIEVSTVLGNVAAQFPGQAIINKLYFEDEVPQSAWVDKIKRGFEAPLDGEADLVVYGFTKAGLTRIPPLVAAASAASKSASPKAAAFGVASPAAVSAQQPAKPTVATAAKPNPVARAAAAKPANAEQAPVQAAATPTASRSIARPSVPARPVPVPVPVPGHGYPQPYPRSYQAPIGAGVLYGSNGISAGAGIAASGVPANRWVAPQLRTAPAIVAQMKPSPVTAPHVKASQANPVHANPPQAMPAAAANSAPPEAVVAVPNGQQRNYREAARRELEAINRGLRYRIRFTNKRSTLTHPMDAQFQPLLAFLKRYPWSRVVVAVHTDSRGTSAANDSLTQGRAEIIKQRLVVMGAPVDRLIAKGMGSRQPIASNQTPVGRSLNRRVEINLQ